MTGAPVADPVWQAEGLGYRYPGSERRAVEAVDMTADRGEIVAVIGPNGSGKSTLLRLLLGALEPASGRASLLGRRAAAWPSAERARLVGVLPQIEEPAFPVTARGLVRMGRYPRLGRWRRPGPADVAAVTGAMERCGVIAQANRAFDTLSGGERQRVRLARALAQEPVALALDEPTAALDVAHEMELWELLAELVRDHRAVLLTTHDLNLAARYADRLVLLGKGRVEASGSPREVLTAAAVERVYGWPVEIVAHPGPGPDRGAPQVVPRRRPVRSTPPDPSHRFDVASFPPAEESS